MEYKIIEIKDADSKESYTKSILERLPEWFGIPEAIEEYVNTVSSCSFWAAFDKEVCIGFISGIIHYGRTGEIYVCGVIPEYQNRGIGKTLVKEVDMYFKENGCKYIIVKTLSDIVVNKAYKKTREFYKRVGFEELVTLREMWSEENPCLIMIKEIRINKRL